MGSKGGRWSRPWLARLSLSPPDFILPLLDMGQTTPFLAQHFSILTRLMAAHGFVGHLVCAYLRVPIQRLALS